MSSRVVAAHVLDQVVRAHRSLSVLLPNGLETLEQPADRAFASEIIYGVLRDYFLLDACVSQMLDKPLRRKESVVRMLLLIGLYQLNSMRVPAYAAIKETADAARELGKNWAVGLINAVLRRWQREADRHLAAVKAYPLVEWNHPQWLLKRLKKDWPEQWQAIARANRQRAPMTLRVNQQHSNAAEYRAQLLHEGIESELLTGCDNAVVLNKPVDVTCLPGFTTGLVSVQDGAAQLAATLLDCSAGMRVLDACAAPGGKTAHILELTPGLELLALDSDAQRASRVSDTLERLGLNATIKSADAARLDEWWDGHLFDRILLDVPCSATGVIRRHPDILHLREERDIASLTRIQAEILNALWQTLKPGGIMLYATCSLLKDENERQLTGFLSRQSDAKELLIDSNQGHPASVGRQILPGENGMDGFYYARLMKSG
ncbi:MAG TPA: 16S rRNA (cytosine(967)-C(5))-methyltransferase RsmB [Gammaproteobacteria bacterium]|nr:16S rRNA (cytosine(967)-C(5))-methyltransferase RsmB [Gammaproteobacteria bacterium]